MSGASAETDYGKINRCYLWIMRRMGVALSFILWRG
jgi:hypothetical protein